MALEGGGSGIVFGYNYSVLPLLEDPTWLAEDAVTHGAHPFMNLWESNEFVKISMDNTWGSSSHNTFFRNNVTRSRSGTTLAVWAVDIEAKNHYENLVGNVLTTPGATGLVVGDVDGDLLASAPFAGETDTGLVYRLGMWTPGSGIENPPSDPVVVDTVYLHGNFDYVTGATIWAAGNTDRTLPPSLYLAARPVFIGGVWPSIGPDLTPKTTAIPRRSSRDSFSVSIPAPLSASPAAASDRGTTRPTCRSSFALSADSGSKPFTSAAIGTSSEPGSKSVILETPDRP